MGLTLAEKILARASGRAAVVPGEYGLLEVLRRRLAAQGAGRAV